MVHVSNGFGLTRRMKRRVKPPEATRQGNDVLLGMQGVYLVSSARRSCMCYTVWSRRPQARARGAALLILFMYPHLDGDAPAKTLNSVLALSHTLVSGRTAHTVRVHTHTQDATR